MKQQELKYKVAYVPDKQVFHLYIHDVWQEATLSLDELLCWIKEDIEEWLIPEGKPE